MTENRDARYIRSHSQQSTQPPSQCSSSFMERVNKIFQASKGSTAGKENTGVKERLRTISPFLQKKLEALKSARTTRVRLFEKLKGTETGPWSTTRRKEERHAAELASVKLIAGVNGYLRGAFAKLRSAKARKPQAVQGIMDLSQVLAFTQCIHCNAVGLTLLTSSTKENLSPKFLDKVKMLLPTRPTTCSSLPPTKPPTPHPQSGQASPDPKDYPSRDNELSMVLYADEKDANDGDKKLSLPDISLIPMEGSLESSLASLDPADPQPVPVLKKQESVVSKEEWDRSTDCKTPACDVSSQSYRRPSPVPRLNISELLPMKKLANVKLNHSGMDRKGNLASVEVLQGSPLFVKKDGKTMHTMERLVGLFKTRLHKAFDMVFLSRVPKRQQADQSLTFEFSREEESLNASGTLTGTFRQHERLCNISAIDPKETKFTEDSFIFECENRPEVSSTVKTAFRILFSRLEKIVSKRKLRGFYSIAGL